MDWNNSYILAGFTFLLTLTAGLILLGAWYGLRKQLDDRKFSFLIRKFGPEVEKVCIHTIADSMDLIPEKMREAKRIMDESE